MHRLDRRLHRQVQPTVFLGCVLGLSPDQDGGKRCGEDSLPDPMWGVLLHLHAVRVAQRGRNLPAADVHCLRLVAQEEHRGLCRQHCGKISTSKDLDLVPGGDLREPPPGGPATQPGEVRVRRPVRQVLCLELALVYLEEERVMQNSSISISLSF